MLKHSQPDLSNCVRELSTGMLHATLRSYNMMLRVIAFLSQTKNWGIEMSKIQDIDWKLNCFVDSDWAGNACDQKSISGWIIFMQNNPICWGSRSQKNVTLSSSEAEYVAVSEIVKEVLYVVHVLEYLKTKVQLPIVIQVDNQGAIFMANNQVSRRTKHIDTRYHLVREFIEDEILKVIFVRSCENTADIFTKNVDERTYIKHAKAIMVE